MQTTAVPTTTQTLLVKLAARPDFSTVEQMPRGAERKQAAYEAIVATARASQGPALELAERLRNEGAVAGYEALVSPNMLVVTPKSGRQDAVAAAFQALDGVKAIYSNGDGRRIDGSHVPPIAPGTTVKGLDVIGEPIEVPAESVARPYGIDLVGAPAAWERGADGTGLVYGSIDTGVDPSHEALANYRGRRDDGRLEHDYNFFDPSGRRPEAHDQQSHGTHTIGTAVGAGIGVAPKATYISAVGLSGNVDSTIKAVQWMLAPTRSDGTAPDPTKAPDVVGMSWWTGSSSEDLFQENIQDLRAAGIEPVKSAGNNGPRRGSISSPGQFPELIATAAVDAKGSIASFSSRGPAPFPKGSSTPKPDFAAPGVDVVSALPRGRYGKMSGTSMAQPHMSGAILAILSRHPELTHDQLVEALAAGAIDKGAPGFDVEYGMGLINVPAALDAAERILAGAEELAPA